MIISLQNHRELQDGHKHACSEGDGNCQAAGNVVASMFRSMAYLHQQNRTLKFRLMEDQTQSAFIYVAVVVVFYAAIIILLLGTNGRRKRHHRSTWRRQSTHPLRQLLKRPTLTVLEGVNANTQLLTTAKQNSL